ncbi:dnaJ homolog subfamily C member 22 [Culicoides brevitarsis]|uniref:dnaJ homolog subfamily C member 22 n=1 Tax=Culicoides brevitarsis TaxID=469753 RepID=UPI00307B1BA0
MGETLSPSKESKTDKKLEKPEKSEASDTKNEETLKLGCHTENKSLIMTYLLWFFGGFFGLHHLYLHRDFHAFAHWCTFGGYFGVGWVVDMFKIPEFVRDANEDPVFIAKFLEKLKANRKPPFSTYRFMGAICLSYLWGQVAMIAIPESVVFGIDFSFLHWIIPFAIALGVWVVGNIGRETGCLWHSVVAAYLSYLSRYFIFDDTYWMTLTVVVTACVFDGFSKQWLLHRPKRRKIVKRAVVISAAVFLYMALWTSYFYFNGTITDSDGDEVPVHEAIHNFLKSPWWTDLKQTLHDTWTFAQHNGWGEIWKQIIDSMDADGEQNAYKVLGVSATASQTEIKTTWRKLSLENHPDKIKDPSQRDAAQKRFMEIQQAYEILSKIKSKRRSRNKKSSDEL